MTPDRQLAALALVALAAAIVCAGLIVLLRPLLQRYALARPNARSSHKVPTPQGAGIAVIAATLLIGGAFAVLTDLRLPVIVLIAGLWFVNLVNFMDGLDLMTAAEAVPITATLVLVRLFGMLPLPVVLIAAALCGALLGFAPFNRPVAKVFLGDVGSLPIGLLLGWCLLQLAYDKQFAAALLLPMYYLADATVTLLRRLAKREPFWA